MRIGVIDSDAIFQHPFFYGKKIEIKRMNPGYCIKNKNFPFSHAYKHCYIRYPFLGYYDRYRFLTEKGILIEQLYF